VGAVCNVGAVKPELDINTCDDAPDNYRYADALKTIEQLKQELVTLQQKAE